MRESEERAPLGFKVFVVLAVLYLVYRFVQMGLWVVERLG